MKCISWMVLFCLLSVQGLLAGPARTIRSNNFTVRTPDGPPPDPFAQKGQWFLNPMTGKEKVCSWEFFDDTDSLTTIAGVVQNITYATPGDSNANIIAFDVRVTVVNDLPIEDVQSGSSSNSHSAA